jgi:voltage-gated potassium channel
MERFLKSLEQDSNKMKSLEKLYSLSESGIHTVTISGPDTQSLTKIEKEFKDKGFLLGVDLTHEEILKKISDFSSKNP